MKMLRKFIIIVSIMASKLKRKFKKKVRFCRNNVVIVTINVFFFPRRDRDGKVPICPSSPHCAGVSIK